jgi:hypothetical protein
VYVFLNSQHVFNLVHIVLDISLSSLRSPWLQAFSHEMSRVFTVVALLDMLPVRVALEGFFYLGGIPSKALLISCSVWGKASSGQVHGDQDIVHSLWGIGGVELWGPLAVVKVWLGPLEEWGVGARPHSLEELSVSCTDTIFHFCLHISNFFSLIGRLSLPLVPVFVTV